MQRQDLRTPGDPLARSDLVQLQLHAQRVPEP